MKKFLSAIAALVCFSAAAQTNIAFTGIAVVASPVISNYNQITLDVTNLTPNKTYALTISRRLPSGFFLYIGFSSPSNSTTIVRQTSNSIPVRFYRVAQTNEVFLVGFDWNSAVSEFDDHDIPCAECDALEEGAQQQEAFHSLLVNLGLIEEYQIPQEILDIITPHPVLPHKK